MWGSKQISKKRESFTNENNFIEKNKDYSEIKYINKLNKSPIKFSINPKDINNYGEKNNTTNITKTNENKLDNKNIQKDDKEMIRKNIDKDFNEKKMIQKDLLTKKKGNICANKPI